MVNYLLKPVDVAQLEEIIQETVEKIQSIKTQNDRILALNKKVQDSHPLLRDKFIGDLLFDPPRTTENIYEELEYFDIQVNYFSLLIAEIDMSQEMKSEFRSEDLMLLLFLVREQIDCTMKENEISYFTYLRNHRTYLVVNDKNDISIGDIAEQISKGIEKVGKFTISIAFGEHYHGATALKNARREVEHALEMRYYLGNQCIISTKDICYTVNKCSVQEVELEDYKKALENGGNISKEVEAICRILMNEDADKAKNFVIEFFITTIRIYEEFYGRAEEVYGKSAIWLNKIMLSDTKEALVEMVHQVSQKAEQQIRYRILSANRQIIIMAVNYLKENYQKDISMEEVAKKVHLSKWYFSRIFKKEMGINYSEYVTSIRIEKAKELWKHDPTAKNYEIAELVGYTDVRYFSQLFRKFTGMTPSEYRSDIYEKANI